MQDDTTAVIERYIPMSEPSFLLLLNLTQAHHGYGLMQLLLKNSDGRINLGPSTVYTILYKMEQDNLIEVVEEVERRKIYRTTPLGLAVLRAELERLCSLCQYACRLMECSTASMKGGS